MFVACRTSSGLNCGGIILRGCAMKPGEDHRTHPIYGGYTITGPVDRAQFLEWVERSKGSSLITDRTVVWADTEAELIAMCRMPRRFVDTSVSGNMAAGDMRAPRPRGE